MASQKDDNMFEDTTNVAVESTLESMEFEGFLSPLHDTPEAPDAADDQRVIESPSPVGTS